MPIRSLRHTVKDCPSWCWVVLSGVLLGLNAPGRHTHLVGMVSLLPLFVVIDRICAAGHRKWTRRLGRILVTCWATGFIAALIAVPWLTYVIRAFGGFSRPVALLITGFGYGAEIALVLFVCFAAPMLAIRQRGTWETLVRLSYFLVAEPLCPKIFDWSFGGITFAQLPWLSQLADVVGSQGLGVYCVGSNLLLLLIWRWKVQSLPIPAKTIHRLLASYLVLWAVGLSYGAWRTHALQRSSQMGSAIHIAAIQPNLSFEQLASNAADHLAREQTVRQLLADSADALSRFPADSPNPRLVVWPESVYPPAYFKDATLRPLIEGFARSHQTFVLLHSVDWDETPPGRKYYGIAVLIGPEGRVMGRYNKIFRIPYGEYIPWADRFPSYAGWLRKHVAHLSEFEKGNDFTVFHLSDDLSLCAPICFDIFSPTIVRNMSRNGAQLAVNLCNLIWFGRTTAPDHLLMTVRWRTVENRIPILLASNNGRSILIDAMGKDAGEQLPLFEKGSLSCVVLLKRRSSVYREYTGWVRAAFVLLFVVTALLGHSRGKIYTNIDAPVGGQSQRHRARRPSH